jgi:uncharacterized protein
VHAAVSREAKSQAGPLKLVEIHREDISTLPRCLAHLRQTNAKRFILFCDDLSFEAHDTFYKTLKAVLEGGVEGRPEHVIFYATSNRRHLTLHHQPIGRVDETVSLSDRFGLWIGFHNCSHDDYLDMVEVSRAIIACPSPMRR